ncbi:hypothetical protein FNV43_RR17561 [Rhamnella rubrinervis]|uniref:Uncharacterized protein n=1 Tax=Rhamnella rubrinervis TaxID=2594499 RepID=A0A8K0GXW6_9ROSA|nr:hypothetical protein FNV43_RR17561 [Rhamnella rubrinervis]
MGFPSSFNDQMNVDRQILNKWTEGFCRRLTTVSKFFRRRTVHYLRGQSLTFTEGQTVEMETEDEPYHKKILSKLTGAVLEEFARSKPSQPLPSQYKNYIAQQLHGFFPIFRTPSHPTYAAHGELISVSENCYMLPNGNIDSVVENGDQSQEGHIVTEKNQSLRQEAAVRNENGVQGCQMEIDDQAQSQEQLIKLIGVRRQKEIAGQIPTQLEEIAVASEHRRKEPHNEMPQGKKPISDIDRTEQLQLLEERIELIDKLTQLERQQNEAIRSQIDTSFMQELFKKRQKETDATAMDPSTIMVSDGDGLSPKKKFIELLLERTKKIEGELLETLSFLSASDHSNMDSTVELLEQNDSKKQKPQGKGQQRILSSGVKPDAALSASLPLQNKNLNLEKQQQSKRRGRPPKPKPVTATTTEELMSFGNQKPEEQLQKKRRGRPPKPKLDGDTTTGKQIDPTQQA